MKERRKKKGGTVKKEGKKEQRKWEGTEEAGEREKRNGLLGRELFPVLMMRSQTNGLSLKDL